MLSMEIKIERDGTAVRAEARASGDVESAPQALPGVTVARLLAFRDAVGEVVASGARISQALPNEALAEAQEIYQALFRDEVRDIYKGLIAAAKTDKILLRFLLRDRALQSVPWEALCEPGTTEGFLGSSPKVLVARGVSSSDPYPSREVRRAVRVLAIAPTSGVEALSVLEGALRGSIDSGEIEWLRPIAGAEARIDYLFDQLAHRESPHVIHFLGHGRVDEQGNPAFRLADDEYGGDSWLKAESFARELEASFDADLRFVFLEACEGAKPGALASAAELFVRSGADAVVAYLWPVRADAARVAAREFYRRLTGSARDKGDVAASLRAARGALLVKGDDGLAAQSLSPVLYLRGTSPVLFDFEGRKIAPPATGAGAGFVTAAVSGAVAGAVTGVVSAAVSASVSAAVSGPVRAAALDPALDRLLSGEFAFLLGDGGDAARAGRDELRAQLTTALAPKLGAEASAMTMSALSQRYSLYFRQSDLDALFQRVMNQLLPETRVPPVVDELARLLRPGVHITLLWLPVLERALARHNPDRAIYVVQPPALDKSWEGPRVLRREPGDDSPWEEVEDLPKQPPIEEAFVVLRLYGGYTPEPILRPPLLTEDDHVQGLMSFADTLPSQWADTLLDVLSRQPVLFAGLSALEWRHRMLLRWLFDNKPAPQGSVAVLDSAAGKAEQEIWTKRGGGLPGRGSVGVLREDGLAAAVRGVKGARGG